jgi:hypothetical protein
MSPPHRGKGTCEDPITWVLALYEARPSDELSRRLQRDLYREGGSAYAAKGALLLLLCRNLTRLGLTDCDIYDSQLPLYMVLEMVHRSSSTVLTQLVSIDL